jgi:RNA polymerase primary sigma factor
MTPDEEIECGRKIQAMNALLDKPADTLTRKEKFVIKRGQRARDRFVLGNMRLVATIARKYLHMTDHMHYADLCQEGAVGLARAADRYDPTRGYKFSTYSYWWVRQSISRSISEKERMIRLPSNVIDQLGHLRRHSEKALRTEGVVPHLDESLEAVKMKREAFDAAIMPYYDWVSTDKPISHSDGCTSIGDVLADPKTEDALEKQMLKIPYRAVLSALERIPEPSQQMLRHFYGIEGVSRLNLREIGELYHVSREAVRQRINKATLSLRVRTGCFNDSIDD